MRNRLLFWGAHACFPLRPDADLSVLERYRDERSFQRGQIRPANGTQTY